MDTTPRHALPYLLSGQAQKHVTLNESLIALDARVQMAVETSLLSSPPETVEAGACYRVGASPTGDWTGHEGQIAAYVDATWCFHSPKAGWIVYETDVGKLMLFDGAIWRALSGELRIDRLSINSDLDENNRFCLTSQSSLFTHSGADHRLSINKNDVGDTCSVLFNTAHTNHAEFGLTGTNDFSLKTSPDGTNYDTALFVKTDTSRIGIGETDPQSQLHVSQTLDARLTIETRHENSGGGFDIINSGSGQSWRVTGQTSLFKLRDHSAGLDKLTLKQGAAGDILLNNCGNVGIGTISPTARLHVDGIIRMASLQTIDLPDPAICGAGCLAYLNEGSGGLVFSDGTNWRYVADNSIVASA